MEMPAELPQASSSVVADYVNQSPAPSRSDLVSQGDIGRDVDVTEELGRGKCEKVPYVRLKDYVTNTMQKLSLSSVSSSSSHSLDTRYPISHFVNCNRCSIGHKNFRAAVNANAEPKSFKEAMEDPKWKEAMQKEITTLEDNKTWSIVRLPVGKKRFGFPMGV
ncbi:hypothetical protein LIER_43284 [Lithospermum erythrorhizon]|uniref:Uncharacterized protein n=1 Tax=Lithospermum erythrorhizon TaxID=34254 RepID=A0AAV3PS57_LITER